MWQSTDQVVLDWWATASPLASPAASISTTTGSRRTRPTRPTLFESVSDPTTDRSAAGRSTAASSNPNDASSTQAVSSTNGLSTGAQAGIGVGVGIFAVLIGVLAFLLYRLRKTRAQMQLMQRQLGPNEVAPSLVARESRTTEPTTANIHEMATAANFQELPGARDQ